MEGKKSKHYHQLASIALYLLSDNKAESNLIQSNPFTVVYFNNTIKQQPQSRTCTTSENVQQYNLFSMSYNLEKICEIQHIRP